jgi:tetratricopeptide (TPR) repeat protein
MSFACTCTWLLLAALLGGQPSADDAQLLVERGRDALKDHRFGEARQALELAVADQPEDPHLWHLLGSSLLGEAASLTVETQEQWDAAEAVYQRAEEALRKAIELNEGSPAWADLGRALLHMGRAGEAIASLYHAQSIGFDSVALRIDLADGLMLAREYAWDSFNAVEAEAKAEEARIVLEKASEGLSIQADVLRRLGDVALAQGDSTAALQYFRRAITIRPSDTDLHEAHLTAVENFKTFDVTIDFYKGLVEEPAIARWYSARAHRLKGNYAYQAEKEYVKAADEYFIAEAELFESSKIQDEYGDAVEAWIPYLRSYRGYALMREGKLPEAEAAFLGALDRDPENEHAKQGLKALMDEYWGQAGGERAPLTKFEELCAYAARVCVADPNDYESWNNYGFFARECRRYEESYMAYRRSMNLAPDNARILNDTALLLVYHLRRDLDKAEQWLREARDISEDELYSEEGPENRDAVEETYGDSMVNLLVLFHQQSRTDDAKDMLVVLEAELPDRFEIDMWKQRLFPESFLRNVESEEDEASVKETPPPVLKDDSNE